MFRHPAFTHQRIRATERRAESAEVPTGAAMVKLCRSAIIPTMNDQPVRTALQNYFVRNDFGTDGGYESTWVFLKFGPLSLPLYNSRARRRAVPIHDLHHLVTGYDTSPKGEAQIATWAIAAGVHDKWFAFAINLPALVYGFVLWPKTTLSAWKAGRSSNSLYRFDFGDWMLELSLAELRDLVFDSRDS